MDKLLSVAYKKCVHAKTHRVQHKSILVVQAKMSRSRFELRTGTGAHNQFVHIHDDDDQWPGGAVASAVPYHVLSILQRTYPLTYSLTSATDEVGCIGMRAVLKTRCASTARYWS